MFPGVLYSFCLSGFFAYFFLFFMCLHVGLQVFFNINEFLQTS